MRVFWIFSGLKAWILIQGFKGSFEVFRRLFFNKVLKIILRSSGVDS